jgi:hypothetical protein
MKRKKKKSSPIASVTCKNCPTTLIQSTNPHFIHAQRHGLCSACSANEIDALNEKLALRGTVNEDSETANAIMVEALLFYAEKTNYGLLGGTRMRTDKGAKARFALNPGKYYLGSVRTVLSEPTKVRSAMEEIQEISERYADSEEGWKNGDMSEIWQIIETLFYEKPEWPEPGAPARAVKPPLGKPREGEC